MTPVMLAVLAPGLAGAFFFLFWVWAVFDVIAMDAILIRNLPKTTWIFLVVFVPPVGAVAWLVLGRPENAGFSAGSSRRSPPKRFDYYNSSPQVRGPEDDPSWQAPRAPRSPSTARSAAAPPAAGSPDSPDPDSIAARERKLLEREAELEKREAALSDTPENVPDEEPSNKPTQTEPSEDD